MAARPDHRLLLLVLVVVAATAWWYRRSIETRPSPAHAIPATLFSKDQVDHFLDEARRAELLDDPLQRCLSYPDPPGSHWSHAAVVAYCRSLQVPRMSFDEVSGLLRSGRADELERRLREQGRMPTAGTASDQLNRVFVRSVFDDGSPETRKLADEWKRQAPRSAFAFAASGMVYVAAASHARGADFTEATSDPSLLEMHRLLVLAHADLDRAVALDPAFLPAYAEMLVADRFERDRGAEAAVAGRALAIDPASYAIHSRLLGLADPRWGGSRWTVHQVASMAKAKQAANPLLVLVQTEAAAIDADLEHCACDAPDGRAAFRRVFDNVADADTLGWAGKGASIAKQPDIALVYLSEAVRFNPAAFEFALSRVNNLMTWKAIGYALAEADRVVALAPKDQRAYVTRGQIHESLRHVADAEEDYRTALDLPGDDGTWLLTRLGDLYVHGSREWDKGWAIAERLIREQPDDPAGWILRGSIQKDEPRPGLHDTITYVMTHFADDPRAQPAIAQMRAILASEPH